ncbi:phage minor head protein [Hymenobacter canadensis]|uniref:Phage minor head protein n=1 Tax=Hymenobacter canadensis TaxID=2999067 RepID=A0ABY7LTH1_9BACT|nr:phage minor head protein [Hymenobacter canadensis]WBA43154.1 phage minor head protein [Hymenobacter canadensis]
MAIVTPFIQERLARLDASQAKWEVRIFKALLKDFELVAATYSLTGDAELAAAVLPQKHLIEALDALYQNIILQEADYEYEYLIAREAKAIKPLASWLSSARSFIMTRGAASIRAITESTRKEIRRVLSTALGEGSSIAAVTRTLRTQITDFSRLRATTIARTELIGAANYGSLTGAISTGLNLQKEWLSTTDSRTRVSHVLASGQQVPINEMFIVGGERCEFPGDPILSAGERIRCRCTVVYVRTG